jgi:hypothetical protein
MKKTTSTIVAGAALGALALYFGRTQDEVNLYIDVGPRDADASGKPRFSILRIPDDADLSWNQRVNWNIRNSSTHPVRVGLEGWRRTNGTPVSPAAKAHQMPGLWTHVDPNGTATIKGRGRLGFFESCKYDIYLNDEFAVDPIVKLVL